MSSRIPATDPVLEIFGIGIENEIPPSPQVSEGEGYGIYTGGSQQVSPQSAQKEGYGIYTGGPQRAAAPQPPPRAAAPQPPPNLPPLPPLPYQVPAALTKLPIREPSPEDIQAHKAVVQEDRGRIRILKPIEDDKVAFDRQRNVEYVQDRSPFEVKIDENKLMWRGRMQPSLLDTKNIRSAENVQSTDRFIQPWFTQEQDQEWGTESLIWVCAPDPATGDARFYTHVCRVYKFHHSSFTGKEVICAGEWIVREGRLRKLSANSGHYLPPIDFLFRAVLQLAPALQPSTKVLLWDVELRQWVERQVQDFIARPSDGGRYKVHPMAH